MARASGRRLEAVRGGPSCSTSRSSWPTTCAPCVGSAGPVENATAPLIDPADGLRIVNEVEQLAAFEAAACRTRRGAGGPAGRAARHARGRGRRAPGLGWIAAVVPPDADGGAERATFGLHSPSDRPIARGDRIHGGVRHLGRPELPGGFAGRVGIGAAGGDPGLRRAAGRAVLRGDRRVVPGAPESASPGGELFAIMSATWATRSSGRSLTQATSCISTNGPTHRSGRGRRSSSRSGRASRPDIIPATGTPYFTTNIEDGLALADGLLRAAFAARYPEAWSRIRRGVRSWPPRWASSSTRGRCRRSEHPLFPPPFILRPDLAMTLA